MVEWVQIPLGPLQTNAYLVYNDKNDCIVIDPGAEGERLNNIIAKQHFQPLAILLTHAHFDHIGAVDAVRDQWGIPVYLHSAEKDWLQRPSLNGSMYFGIAEPVVAKEAEQIIHGEHELSIGSFTINVMETPGHSPGSLSFYFSDSNVVFAGDALFAGSIGRTDLPGGNHQQLLDSIHNRLLRLPEDTIVAPGHGPETSIEAEMDSNPFLNGF